MTTPPPLRPDVTPNVVDRAKFEYAIGTKLLATAQYQLAELAGIGVLDRDESMSMKWCLFRACESLYSKIQMVRDEDTDDSTWDAVDNSYSDGRVVVTWTRIGPAELDTAWEYNRFLLGDGAVQDHPRSTVCHIAPMTPECSTYG
jgi:hypothetical protein